MQDRTSMFFLLKRRNLSRIRQSIVRIKHLLEEKANQHREAFTLFVPFSCSISEKKRMFFRLICFYFCLQHYFINALQIFDSTRVFNLIFSFMFSFYPPASCSRWNETLTVGIKRVEKGKIPLERDNKAVVFNNNYCASPDGL